MSCLSNEVHIFEQIPFFSGVTNDGSEHIISIFTVDGQSVFWLFLRKPVGDSWGLLGDDSQRCSLTPCKNPACYQFCPPEMLLSLRYYLSGGNSSWEANVLLIINHWNNKFLILLSPTYTTGAHFLTDQISPKAYLFCWICSLKEYRVHLYAGDMMTLPNGNIFRVTDPL